MSGNPPKHHHKNHGANDKASDTDTGKSTADKGQFETQSAQKDGDNMKAQSQAYSDNVTTKEVNAKGQVLQKDGGDTKAQQAYSDNVTTKEVNAKGQVLQKDGGDTKAQGQAYTENATQQTTGETQKDTGIKGQLFQKDGGQTNAENQAAGDITKTPGQVLNGNILSNDLVEKIKSMGGQTNVLQKSGGIANAKIFTPEPGFEIKGDDKFKDPMPAIPDNTNDKAFDLNQRWDGKTQNATGATTQNLGDLKKLFEKGAGGSGSLKNANLKDIYHGGSGSKIQTDDGKTHN